MIYSILEAKIRIPLAKKTSELLTSRAVHHIKLAHPKYKNYYLLCIPENERDTILEEYSNIGQLAVIQQRIDSAEPSDLINTAQKMKLDILEVNGAPYSASCMEPSEDEASTPIYELDEHTGAQIPCNEAAVAQQKGTQRDTSNTLNKETPAPSSTQASMPSHIICQGQTFSAKLDYTSAGFHIRFGSRLRKDVTASWKGTAAYKQREQLVKDGILVKKDKHLIMMADYLCKSPSTAASMIRGASSNGWTAMKYEDGTKLVQGKFTYREFDEITA